MRVTRAYCLDCKYVASRVSETGSRIDHSEAYSLGNGPHQMALIKWGSKLLRTPS